MSKPLISVIIPVYNVEAYLHDCIGSVLRQTYTNLEIILVNDGSPDRCGEICEEYASKDTRIVVLRKENGGLYQMVYQKYIDDGGDRIDMIMQLEPSFSFKTSLPFIKIIYGTRKLIGKRMYLGLLRLVLKLEKGSHNG